VPIPCEKISTNFSDAAKGRKLSLDLTGPHCDAARVRAAPALPALCHAIVGAS